MYGHHMRVVHDGVWLLMMVVFMQVPTVIKDFSDFSKFAWGDGAEDVL